MPFGYGGFKRDRDEVVGVCTDCDDEITEEEDFGACHNCDEYLCSECMRSTCVVCEECLCEGCTESCNDCNKEEDEYTDRPYVKFHKCCQEEHLSNCNAKSRAQRNASAAAYRVKETESELTNKKRELARIQDEIIRLESQLKSAKEDQAKADKELQEETASEKKTSDQEAQQAQQETAGKAEIIRI